MRGGKAHAYSPPVTMAIDPSVTGASANQVRAISIGRSGTDFRVGWDLLQENGQVTYLHFERTDGGGTFLLTPYGVPSGTKEYLVPAQAMNSPCGTIFTTANSPTGPQSLGTELPSSDRPIVLEPNEPVCDPTPPPPPDPLDYVFANRFHHRDHLGSLRVVTDDAGAVVATHDFYPFGTEMTVDGGDGSRKRFTGHERDAATGLDYMLARYCGASLGRFHSTDPVPDTTRGRPSSWNLHVFVADNPISFVDRTGEALELVYKRWDHISWNVQRRVMANVEQRFRNAGVWTVHSRVSSAPCAIRCSLGQRPSVNERWYSVRISVTDQEMDSFGFTSMGPTGQNPRQPSHVSTFLSPTSQAALVTFLTNVISHEIGHHFLLDYALDGKNPYGGAPTKTGTPGTIMQQVRYDAEGLFILSVVTYEFSSEDAAVLAKKINRLKSGSSAKTANDLGVSWFYDPDKGYFVRKPSP